MFNNNDQFPFAQTQPQALPPRDRGLVPLFQILSQALLAYSGSLSITLLCICIPQLFWFGLAISIGLVVFLVVQSYWGRDGKFLGLALVSLFGTIIGFTG